MASLPQHISQMISLINTHDQNGQNQNNVNQNNNSNNNAPALAVPAGLENEGNEYDEGHGEGDNEGDDEGMDQTDGVNVVLSPAWINHYMDIQTKLELAVESPKAISELKKILSDNHNKQIVILEMTRMRLDINYDLTPNEQATPGVRTFYEIHEAMDGSLTPSFIFSEAFNRAAQIGNIEVMKFFLYDFFYLQYEVKETVLRHFLEGTSKTLEYGGSSREIFLNPISWAARSGQLESVKFLHSLDPN